MVDLVCQNTDWVGGNDEEVLDGILLWDGLILLEVRFDAKWVVDGISQT